MQYALQQSGYISREQSQGSWRVVENLQVKYHCNVCTISMYVNFVCTGDCHPHCSRCCAVLYVYVICTKTKMVYFCLLRVG
jgi:hypothetical protein